MAVVIAALLIFHFRSAIDNFINRMVEGDFFGQKVKAVPPPQEQKPGLATSSNDLLNKAAESITPSTAQNKLPPELENDPRAAPAIEYVKSHPIETVVEYKRLNFAYQAERLFSRIYGTQVSLLILLAEHPVESYTLAQLAHFHEEYQKLANRTDYQLRFYVQFLVSFGVITTGGPHNEQTYRISQDGIEFLSYIKANYPEEWNKRPF